MNIKQKQSKQTTTIGTESQKWRSHGGLSVGWGRGENGGKVQGIRSINGRYKNTQGELKNSKRNGEAKVLICTTHEHELRWGNAAGRVVEGNKGGKKWDNCNSIINKIYLNK